MMNRSIGCMLSIYGILLSFAGKTQEVQRWNKYSISRSINTYNLNYKKLYHGKSKAALENNITNFYLYRNGALVKPATKPAYNFFPAGCLCFKFDDTLLLNSGLGRLAGVGVGIKIYGNKFTSTLHAKAGENSEYKFKKDDTLYTNDITVEPEFQSLRLFRRPLFSANETIIGEYRAVFNRFYQKNNDKEESRKYTVRLIFKCKVTSMDSIKETLGVDNK